MKLWLDDFRDPVKWTGQRDWIWVKTVEDAIHYLSTERIEFLSFDHDLGDINTDYTKTGYDLAKWIEEKAYNGELMRFPWDVHSDNPEGSRNIYRAMTNADRYWTTQDKKNNSP